MISTAVMVFTALGISLIVPNMKMIVTILGSVSSPIVCFILPCLFYIKTFPGQITRIDLLMSWLVMILAGVLGTLGLIVFCIRVG